MEKKTIEAEKTIGFSQVQVPLRAESAPTGLREAAEILWEDARLYLSPATAADGGVQAEGIVYCQALYRLSGDSGLRVAACEAPLSEMLEIPGAAKGMSAACEGEIEHLEAEYTGGRVVFTGAVNLRPQVRTLFEAEIVESVSGDGVESRTQNLTSRKLNAESAAFVHLRDEVSLPAALRARGVLITRSTVRKTDCEREEGGVRVGGEVLVEALVRCGVEERPVAMVKYALPFEQALSFPDWVDGTATGFAAVKKLECELDDEDDGEAALKISCEVSVSAGLYAEQEIAAVSDAYGTKDMDLEAEKTRLQICTGARLLEGREDFRGELLLQEGTAGVGAVLAVRAQPCISETEGDTVRGVVESVCLYVPSGREQVACVRGETPFEMKFSDPIPANSKIRMEAQDVDAISVVSDRMEVRCTLTARCECAQEETMEVISNLMEKQAAKVPSALIIHYATGKEELWDIAKRYRVRISALQKTNPEISCPKAGDPILVCV